MPALITAGVIKALIGGAATVTAATVTAISATLVAYFGYRGIVEVAKINKSSGAPLGGADVFRDKMGTTTMYIPTSVEQIDKYGPHRYVTFTHKGEIHNTPFSATIGLVTTTITITGRCSTHAFSATYMVYNTLDPDGGNMAAASDGTELFFRIEVEPINMYASPGLTVDADVAETNALILTTNVSDEWRTHVIMS